MTKGNASTFAILGGGNRGTIFAKWLAGQPAEGRVVAVAEPVSQRRKYIANLFSIPPEMQFEQWEALLAKPKLAEAIVNTLPDRLHLDSALAAIDAGYHLLLEKPMATSLAGCQRIDDARRQKKAIVSVCHSLRYHAVYAEVKRLLTANTIGRLITFDQIECVEPIHQSHSFVRGNWANESRSTFMLLAKSCHDIDVLTYLVGKPCRRVSSFGSLTYFRQESAPLGTPMRCTDGCPIEHECAYFAPRVYLGPNAFWGTDALLGQNDAEKFVELKTGPYGRCVFHADNDVVDHQVVSFEYDDDITGTFTMTAFASPGTRRLRLNGTQGEIQADIDNRTVRVTRFADHADSTTVLADATGSHGGSDAIMFRNFTQAIRTKDASNILTGTAESLSSHRIVFAAELSRREKRMIDLSEFSDSILLKNADDATRAKDFCS